jgi:hypothetical protein
LYPVPDPPVLDPRPPSLPLTKTKHLKRIGLAPPHSSLLSPLSKNSKPKRNKNPKKLETKTPKTLTLSKEQERNQNETKREQQRKRTLSALNAIFPPAALSTSAML